MLSQVKKHFSRKANLTLISARTGLVLCTGITARCEKSGSSRLLAVSADSPSSLFERLADHKLEPYIYFDSPEKLDFELYNRLGLHNYLTDLSRGDLARVLWPLELYANSPTLSDFSEKPAHEVPISLVSRAASEPADSELDRAAAKLESKRIRVRYYDGTLKPHRLLTRAEALNMLTPREYFEAALESLADDGYIYRDIHISDPYAAAAIFSKDKGLFGSINLVPDSLMSGETLGELLESLGFDCSLDGSAPITRRTAIIKLAAIL